MRVPFLNTEIDNLTFSEALTYTDHLISDGSFHYIVTPNLDHIVQLETNSKLRCAYKNASLILADGKSIIWLSKLTGNKIKEKVSGSDFFPKLCELAAKKDYKIFILGSAPGVGLIAKKNLENKHRGINITGVYSPPFGFEKNQKEIGKIISLINASQSNIVAVALGAPKQELFIYDLWKENKVNVNIAIGIGATIDFEAEVLRRAPKFVSDVGLEWLFRITQDPKRLLKRYWNDIVSIVPIIVKYRNNSNND